MFHADSRGLVSKNFRGSSYQKKTTGSARVSRLSLRFLWLLPMHLNILADHNFQILYSTNDLPMILLLLSKVLA